MLERLGYWPRTASGPWAGLPTGRPHAVAELFACLGAVLAPEGFGRGAHLACVSTTVASPRLWVGSPDSRALPAALRAIAPAARGVLVNAYQCAGWVQALRVARSLPGIDRILLVILDADIDDLSWFDTDRVWGRSRQGVLAAELRREPLSPQRVHVSGEAVPGREVMCFGRAVARFQAPADGGVFFGPFFPARLRSVFALTTPGLRRAPDLYETYGHCFGADPWIGLAHEIRCRGRGRTMRATLGSLAYSGVVGLHEIDVAADCAVANFAASGNGFEGVRDG